VKLAPIFLFSGIMKTLILLILSVLAVSSQTAVPINQIKAPSVPAVELLAIVGGRLVPIALGPGLGITNNQIVVMATAAPSVSVVQFRLSRNSDGSFIVTPGAALYTRNGVVMEVGKDFTFESGKLVPSTEWLPDDLVIQHAVRINGTPAGLP
jgi:hypothetical protein